MNNQFPNREHNQNLITKQEEDFAKMKENLEKAKARMMSQIASFQQDQ